MPVSNSWKEKEGNKQSGPSHHGQGICNGVDLGCVAPSACQLFEVLWAVGCAESSWRCHRVIGRKNRIAQARVRIATNNDALTLFRSKWVKLLLQSTVRYV